MKAAVALLLLLSPLQAQRSRCGTPEPSANNVETLADLADCGYFTNVPQPEYEPTFFYDVPIVFHVIQSSSGEGFLSESTIRDQIDVLNEDFQALPGSPGAPGTDGKIRFHLARTDPSGNPTTGITYTTNDTWFQDDGNYWSSLAWDPDRYVNVYTNAVPCCYGYVSVWPTQGAGHTNDRVVVWYDAVGGAPTAGWPLNRGRTATHELGHYLGLYHTFCGGCGSAQDCYSTGDLICDTNGEAFETSGCPGSKSSCGSADPIHNYMDYTDDPCLWEFTPEQVNRMRCTLQNWRPDLPVSFPALQVVRPGSPPNPTALVPGPSGPSVGETWNPLIDHASFAPDALLDILAIAVVPLNFPIGPEGMLLCAPPFLASPTSPSPGEPFAIPIPNDPVLFGAGFCAQGASISAFGPAALANALDCIVGN